MNTKEKEILNDVCSVARGLGKKPGDEFTRSEYLGGGARFSAYDIYDGGTSWAHYCETAGYKTRTKEAVPDEVYCERLKRAVETLGRLPKTSERKRFGLNFQKRRWPTLEAFIKAAASRGIVTLPDSAKAEEVQGTTTKDKRFKQDGYKEAHDLLRAVPPIPEKTRRKRWERTGVERFPHAPQDESGVVALFSILCTRGIIPWQILDLNSGKGIDAIVYDDRQRRELRVELKHILSRSNWNHSVDSLDYVVCWENRWRDFPKPVHELKSLVKR